MMQPFEKLNGLVAPMDRSNVDTDAIIPKQYLKSIHRTGFGQYAFDDWRYLDAGDLDTPVESRRPNPDFELNNPAYAGAEILLTRKNFGCGSSREHAVWALADFGFRCVIAPSFADIFFNNCFKNGVLPMILDEATVDRLFNECEAAEGYRLIVDLPTQTLTTPSGEAIVFDIDAFRKDCLIRGLDDIGLTLQQADAIRAYEAKRQVERPWLFNSGC